MKARLHEIREPRDRQCAFKDRNHAGKVLAGMLEPLYGKGSNALVLAIPSGGVRVALDVEV